MNDSRKPRPRWRKTALLAIVAVSVMAMQPRCTVDDLAELLGPQFVSTALVVGVWAITYDLVHSTCSGDDPTAHPFVAHANVGTELVGATHFLLWAFSDAEDFPIRGPFDVHTGQFEGETGMVPTGSSGVMANEMWSGVDIDVNSKTHFMDGTSRVDFFFEGSKFCERRFVIWGERTETVDSSARFKQDVRSLLPEGASILGLRPVAFRYLEPYGDPGTTRVGLLAEDVVRIHPEAVALDVRGRPLGIDYDVLTGLVVEDGLSRAGLAVERTVTRLTGRR